jgi:hypothetical protein
LSRTIEPDTPAELKWCDGNAADATVPSELADNPIETERALRKALNAAEALLSAPPATVISLVAAHTGREHKSIDCA